MPLPASRLGPQDERGPPLPSIARGRDRTDGGRVRRGRGAMGAALPGNWAIDGGRSRIQRSDADEQSRGAANEGHSAGSSGAEGPKRCQPFASLTSRLKAALHCSGVCEE